jgi:regulator of sigma E protease
MHLLQTILLFLVTLGILVFVHEFGHFLAAKLFHMRVDRFSIGFPPRAFGKTFGETDYCVSWIPFGGYVKIAGMIDESFDTEHLNRPAEPWEFRSKPIWQRMIVISAGVVMNLLLAIAIFWWINYHQGKIVRETTEIAYVLDSSAAAQGGVLSGDKILRVNGSEVTNWEQILNEIYIEDAGADIHLTVRRGGHDVELLLPRSSIPDPGQAPLGIVPPFTKVVVSTIEPGMPAAHLGLSPGDTIVSLGGTPLRYDEKLREIVQAHADIPLAIEWRHGDTTRTGTILPTKEGKIGISYGAAYTGPVTRTEYTLLEALPRGTKDVINATALFIHQIVQIITGKVSFSQSVGGPIRIAQLATQTAEIGFFTYLGFMGLLSVSLAILNFFPFPALDGGHFLFLAYEAVFRREIPARVKVILQQAGMILLLAFMAFVVYNDLLHF